MVFRFIPHQVFLREIPRQRGMPLAHHIGVPDAKGFEVADHAFDEARRLIARGVTEVDFQFDVRASRHEAHDAHLVVVRTPDDDGAQRKARAGRFGLLDADNLRSELKQARLDLCIAALVRVCCQLDVRAVHQQMQFIGLRTRAAQAPVKLEQPLPPRQFLRTEKHGFAGFRTVDGADAAGAF